ncbi:hypothetical protein AGIG_G3901 [Arapaima gigas]
MAHLHIRRRPSASRLKAADRQTDPPRPGSPHKRAGWSSSRPPERRRQRLVAQYSDRAAAVEKRSVKLRRHNCAGRRWKMQPEKVAWRRIAGKKCEVDLTGACEDLVCSNAPSLCIFHSHVRWQHKQERHHLLGGRVHPHTHAHAGGGASLPGLLWKKLGGREKGSASCARWLAGSLTCPRRSDRRSRAPLAREKPEERDEPTASQLSV